MRRLAKVLSAPIRYPQICHPKCQSDQTGFNRPWFQALLAIGLVFFLVSGLAVPTTSQAQSAKTQSNQAYAQGLSALQAGDAEGARSIWTKLALEGSAKAQYSLALLLETGKDSLQPDLKQAVRFYTMAADAGVAEAQTNLGLLYVQGRGVSQNPKLAVKYWQKSAAAGHAMALFNLGLAYFQGTGVDIDEKEAVALVYRSAMQNLKEAQFALGQFYRNGVGTTQSDEEALYWYRLADRQGHDGANKAISELKEKGVKFRGAPDPKLKPREARVFAGDAASPSKMAETAPVLSLSPSKAKVEDNLFSEAVPGQTQEAPGTEEALVITIEDKPETPSVPATDDKLSNLANLAPFKPKGNLLAKPKRPMLPAVKPETLPLAQEDERTMAKPSQQDLALSSAGRAAQGSALVQSEPETPIIAPTSQPQTSTPETNMPQASVTAVDQNKPLSKPREVMGFNQDEAEIAYREALVLMQSFDGDRIDNGRRAAQKILEAALAGNARAQRSLGEMYLLGIDIRRNEPQALFWLREAERNGIEDINGFADALELLGFNEPAQPNNNPSYLN